MTEHHCHLPRPVGGKKGMWRKGLGYHCDPAVVPHGCGQRWVLDRWLSWQKDGPARRHDNLF
jgi:hypothetical protein